MSRRSGMCDPSQLDWIRVLHLEPVSARALRRSRPWPRRRQLADPARQRVARCRREARQSADAAPADAARYLASSRVVHLHEFPLISGGVEYALVAAVMLRWEQ